MKSFLILLAALSAVSSTLADEKPEYTDYCKQLEHEIQGRKHGFLAGNVTYYVGGFHASWETIEDETIGLTHPFHHDLRNTLLRCCQIFEEAQVAPNQHFETGP